MTEKLPEPLVPHEIDLRDYREFPLEFGRLFDSETWTLWSDRERVVGLRLWCASWHEEPCGSLPTDDRLLSKAAGYGDAVKAFLKVKEAVLRGWILCADGRLYHPVVAEKAIDKWRTKRRKVIENKAEAERKRRKRGSPPGQGELSGIVSGGHGANVHPDKPAAEGKGREGEGEEPPCGPPDAAPAEVVAEWNAMVEALKAAKGVDLPSVQLITEKRKRAIRARLAQAGGIEGIRVAFAKVAASPSLRGERNGRDHQGWRADFDFVMREESFTKLMEGKYDDRIGHAAGGTGNGFVALDAEAQRRAGAGDL